MAEAFLAAIPADEFPYPTEVITGHMMQAGYESADFEFGLGLILDGLERALDPAWHWRHQRPASRFVRRRLRGLPSPDLIGTHPAAHDLQRLR